MTTTRGAGDRDTTVLDRLDRLYTAVISDVLDQLGYRAQVMAPRIRPLYPEARLSGFARTVHVVPVDRAPARREDYYKGELLAIEQLQPGDVMVVSTTENCFWGELLAVAARCRGARGIVLDGYTRDASSLISMRFPTFITGIHVADALGRVDVDELGSQIKAGDVTVCPDDLIMADFDGIVVIPGGIVDDVIRLAEEKVSGENLVRRKLEEGMSVSEAFMTYGVL